MVRIPDIGSLAPEFLGSEDELLEVDNLKRNAEYLTISRLLCSRENHAVETDEIRQAYSFLSDSIELICSRHPQYYRMLLSIAYNLYFFGIIDRSTLDRIFADAYSRRTFDVETSDICKLDARYIYSLHDENLVLFDSGQIEPRTERFLTSQSPFNYPNRDAGYTFTHIVFFLTYMGEKELPFAENIESVLGNLINIGTFCYLSDDHDLLAEVMLCFIFLGSENRIPKCWTSFLDVEYQEMLNDKSIGDHHKFLVIHWYQSIKTLDAAGQKSEMLHAVIRAGVDLPSSDLSILSDFGERLADYEIQDKAKVRQALEHYVTSATAGKFFDVEAYHHDADTIWRAIIGRELF